MKTITEILGGMQILMGISFNLQDCFEEYLTEEHRCFLAMLRVIEDAQPILEMERKTRGRIPYEDQPFMRSFLARNIYQFGTNRRLRNRLVNDSNLRAICGFSNSIPSEATFSRRMKKFCSKPLMTETLNNLVAKYQKDHLVGHINRDSTAIPARETPINKKNDVAIQKKSKRKRGRPRKGEVVPLKEPTVIEQQINRSARNSLSKLEKDCSWGCKKNSQGKVSWWKGYKLHLDVTDTGLPVTAIVTSANVHDSQVAIPMEKLTEKKVQHLYSLMDAAYDAQPIYNYIKGSSRIPLIDPNKRKGSHEKSFDPAEKQRYKIRTTVERANAHLKDWLIPDQIYVRGFEKVSFILLSSVVCLAALKILQYFILPSVQKAA
jgi:transposase